MSKHTTLMEHQWHFIKRGSMSNIYYWNGTDDIAYLDVSGEPKDLPSPQVITAVGKVVFEPCPDNPSCIITKDGKHIILSPEEQP